MIKKCHVKLNIGQKKRTTTHWAISFSTLCIFAQRITFAAERKGNMWERMSHCSMLFTCTI